MIGPRGSFRLKIDTAKVGSAEGCFWRTIRMETNVVNAILAALTEDTHPAFFIGRRISCLWKAAVLHRSTEPDGTSVNQELASFGGDVSHAELGFINVVTCMDGKLIDHRIELIPSLHLGSEVDGKFQFVLQCFF